MGGRFLNVEEIAEIERLLNSGVCMEKTARITGRSPTAVRRVRDMAGLAPLGARPTPQTRTEQELAKDEETAGIGVGEPWMPAEDFDPHGERPNQERWLAMVAAAGPTEHVRLREVVYSVLGLSRFASDETIRLTLICERRTADELAAAYITARGQGAT